MLRDHLRLPALARVAVRNCLLGRPFRQLRPSIPASRKPVLRAFVGLFLQTKAHEHSYGQAVPEPERVAARRHALGSTLRALRLAAGMTQESLALKAGLDRSFYVEVETGKHSLTVDRLFDIADALDLQPAVLLASVK